MKRAMEPCGWLASLCLLAATGCSWTDDPSPVPTPDPKPGDTEFVSAAGQSGQRSPDNAFDDGESGAASDSGDERTVEEGDIYRVLGGGLIGLKDMDNII